MEHTPSKLTPLPTQANTDSVHYQPYRVIDLDGAQCVISRCQIMYMNIAIYFPTRIIVYRNIPEIFCLLSIDCSFLFRLFNQNNRRKFHLCSSHLAGCIGHEQSENIHLWIGGWCGGKGSCR